MLGIFKKIVVILITVDIIKNLLREDNVGKIEIVLWQMAVIFLI